MFIILNDCQRGINARVYVQGAQREKSQMDTCNKGAPPYGKWDIYYVEIVNFSVDINYRLVYDADRITTKSLLYMQGL